MKSLDTLILGGIGAGNATNGVSASGGIIRLGHAAAGSGLSDFTANRYMYLANFALQIGGSAGNDIFHLDGLSGNMALGTSSPNPSAKFQIDSTNKGFLKPRMTTTQRNLVGGVLTIPVTGGGSGYVNGASVTFVGGTGTGATAVLVVSGGAITAVTVTNAGTGYGTTSPPTITAPTGVGATFGTITVGPPEGLEIYNTTTNLPNFWNGTAWSVYGNTYTAGTYLTLTAGAFDLKPNIDYYINTVRVGLGAGSVANNTAFGFEALNSNTTGDVNTAIGYQALKGNIIGTGNLAIGAQALLVNTGDHNYGIGYTALAANIGGSRNLAIGYQSAFKNVTGNDIVAIGYQALRNATTNTGSSTVAIGANSLYQTVNGLQNIGIGYFALYSNISGHYNTGVGYSVMSGSTGSGNTAIGYMAGYTGGSHSGGNNIWIGYQAADNVTSTSANNIVIGYDIDLPVTPGNGQMTIGNLIYATGLGATGTTVSTGKIGFKIAAPTASVHLLDSALGVTQDDTKGFLLQNDTAAAAGAQQISPAIRWCGQGWKTNATAASQAVCFRAYVLPVQGAANPTGSWILESSINGGAYSTALNVDYLGNIVLGGIGASATRSVTYSGTLNGFYIGQSSNSKLTFWASGTEMMTISTSGALLLGSSTDNNLTKVDIVSILGAAAAAATTAEYSGIKLTDSYGGASGGSGKYKPVNIIYTINNTGTVNTGTATGIFLNAIETALNGMVHNLMNLNVGSVSRLSVSNAGLFTITNITGAGSGSLAGGVMSINQTWNTSGTPTAYLQNITDTASNANSLLADWQLSTVSIQKIGKLGTGFNLGASVPTTAIDNAGGTALGSLISSAGTLNLSSAHTIYVFNGTTTTWSLPTVAASCANHVFFIKNRGSGNITLDVTGGGSTIYDTSVVASIIIPPGEARIVHQDTTYWNVM